MSWLSNLLTGDDDKRRDLARSKAQADAADAAAKAASRAEYEKGTAQGIDTLNQGQTTSQQYLSDAEAKAQAAFDQRFAQARSDLGSNFARAEEGINKYFDPYIQSGQSAQGLYDQYLDPAKQAQFFANYQESPYAAFEKEMADRQAAAQANAGGSYYGAKGGLIRGRVQQELAGKNLSEYVDRLQRQGELGAGYAARAGESIANIRTGLGTQLGNLGQNEASTYGNLAYNAGAKRSDINDRYSMAKSAAQTELGGKLGDTESGFGQRQSNRFVDYGNALSQTRGLLPQFLGNLAGTVIRGFTPTGLSGMNAFQAMGGALGMGGNKGTNSLSGGGGFGTGSNSGTYDSGSLSTSGWGGNSWQSDGGWNNSLWGS